MARKEEGGIVIMSEFANAHEFLNGALAVNPWDVESIMNQLERTTEMTQAEILQAQQRDLESMGRRERRLWSSQVIQNLLESVELTKLAALHDPAGEVVSEDELHSITPHLVVGVWTRREA